MAGMFSFGKKNANIRVQAKSYGNNNSKNYEQNFEVESDVVVNATVAPSDTGAKESSSFFSFLKNLFSPDDNTGASFFDKVESILDITGDAISDFFGELFGKEDKNEWYTDSIKRKGQENAEKQKQEMADNFYNTTFQELNKKYDGKFKATNGEEAITELTDYSKQLQEELKELKKISDRFNRCTDPNLVTIEMKNEALKNVMDKEAEIAEIDGILASYKMANEQIEFNSIYTEYEKEFQEEFSKNYTIDPTEFESYLKSKYEANNEELSYEEWYNDNYIDVFMDFYNSQYENWKIAKYYSTENLDGLNKNEHDYLTDSEKATYNYLYTEFGKDVAKDYLDFMEEKINERKGYELAQEFLAKLDGSGSDYVYTSAKGFLDGVESFGEGLSNWINGDAKLDVSDYETMYILQGLQSGEISNSNIFLEHVYNISTSVGNMTVPMIAGIAIDALAPGAGSIISTSLLGLSAAGNAYDSALEGGNTEIGSRLYSLFVGASEATLSYFLSGIPGMSGLEKTLAGKLAGEFTEEFLQTYIETFLGVAFLNDSLDSVDWDKLLLEAGQAGIYGLITAAAMNGTVEVGKVLCEMSDLEFCVAYGGLLYDLYNNTDNPTDFKDALEQNHPELVNEYNDYLENQTNEQGAQIGEDLNTDVNAETAQVGETENTGNVDSNNDADMGSDLYSDVEVVYVPITPVNTVDNVNTFNVNENGFKKSFDDVFSDYINNKVTDQSFETYLKNNGIEVVKFNSKEQVIDYFGDPKLFLYSKIIELSQDDSNLTFRQSLLIDELVHKFETTSSSDINSDELFEEIKDILTEEEIEYYMNLFENGLANYNAQNMTDAQKKAIYSYTAYLGMELNKWLNGYKPSTDKYKSIDNLQTGVSKDFADKMYWDSNYNMNKDKLFIDGNIIEELDSIIQNSNYDNCLISYRGVEVLFDENNNLLKINNLQIGDTFTSGGYQSSSLLLDSCYGITNDADIILEIIIPPNSGAAAYIENLSGCTEYNQMEILGKRNTKFTVVGDAYYKPGYGQKRFIPVVIE